MKLQENEQPIHHQPITHGYDTGQVGTIGDAWYSFMRVILRASEVIDTRRSARQVAAECEIQEKGQRKIETA